MIIRGQLCEGEGEGRKFTQLPWAKSQFLAKLGFKVWPGTLNLKLQDAESRRLAKALKSHPGIPIAPPATEHCSATCYPVLVEGEIEGAIVVPHVPDYPTDKLEIIAAVHVRGALALSVGAAVEVEVLVPNGLGVDVDVGVDADMDVNVIDDRTGAG